MKPNAKQQAVYRLALDLAEEAYQQGLAGMHLHGDPLFAAEFIDKRPPLPWAPKANHFRYKYQKGLNERVGP